MPDAGRSAEVAQIVASVGPYMSVAREAASARDSARAGGSASPPTRTRRPLRAAGSSVPSSDGVPWTMVASSSSAARAAGSRTSARSARTIVAPLISGANSSSAAMSNAIVVTATSRSPGVSLSWAFVAIRKFVSARCGIATPLGRPVEPEV
ncbi:Uncharacterised protein [Actinomadura madurae]|nr:hypothetical protein [Actinomadura madurae]SPT57632.1 Uncharacterised protein [Actinomadura madurae]